METAEATTDVIQYAAQLGRLDFISALLATIALMLGAGAFPVFFYLRSRATQAAEAALDARVQEWEQKFERHISERAEAILIQVSNDYMDVLKGMAQTEKADEIAGAQNDQSDEHL